MEQLYKERRDWETSGSEGRSTRAKRVLEEEEASLLVLEGVLFWVLSVCEDSVQLPLPQAWVPMGFLLKEP